MRQWNAKERPKNGEHSRAHLWLHREASMEATRAKIGLVDRGLGNSKYRSTSDLAALHNEVKIATAIAFKEKLFGQKVENEKAIHGRNVQEKIPRTPLPGTLPHTTEDPGFCGKPREKVPQSTRTNPVNKPPSVTLPIKPL